MNKILAPVSSRIRILKLQQGVESLRLALKPSQPCTSVDYIQYTHLDTSANTGPPAPRIKPHIGYRLTYILFLLSKAVSYWVHKWKYK